jgi:nitroreductase
MSMNVWTAITTQRAVRSFSERPVPDEALERILEAARRAPSSTNSQPWEFIIVRDRELLGRLAEVGQYAGHLANAAVAVALVAEDHDDPELRGTDAYDLGHATQNMMLSALELGIGSVHASVWWPDKSRELLGLPPGKRCDYLISLGYPASDGLLDAPRRNVPRRPLAELIHHERW